MASAPRADADDDPRGRPPGFRLPALVLLVAALVLAWLEGGFAGSRSYPVAALALGLAVVASATGAFGLARGQRPIAVAVGAFAALTALSYASILWADAPADALAGSNRMALYLLAFVLAAAVPWPVQAARAVFVVVAAGAGLVALATLFHSATGPDAAGVLLDGRLSAPLGYANATASLWLIALWPALALAVDERVAPGARAAALGTAALLLESALLTQSRGAALAFGVVAIAFVACSPRRGAVLLALGAVLAATALAASAVLDVRKVTGAAGAGAALAEARVAIALSCAGLAALAALVLVLVARRSPQRWLRGLDGRRLGDRFALALGVAGTLAALVAVGSPVGWAHDRWDDFRSSGYTQVQSGASRFSGTIGSNRYDFYRVALDEFADHPLAGIGSDNFQVAYLEHRRSDEAPRYPHSLALQILSQLGLLGAGAFLVLLAAAAVAVRRAMRSAGRARGDVVAAAAGFLAFLVQAMGDWLWSFPALGMLALILLGVALRAGREDEPAAPAWRPGRRARAAVVVVAIVAATGLGALALSSRLVRSAQATAGADPAGARSELELAARLDPLDADALVSAAILARRDGDAAQARADLDVALRREPRSWFAHFERGLLAASQDDRPTTLAQLAAARALNPRQPVIMDAIAAERAGRPVDAQSLEAALARQLELKLQPTGS